MSTHVLSNLLNELEKEINARIGLSECYLFFAKSLINSIFLEHECQILFII